MTNLLSSPEFIAPNRQAALRFTVTDDSCDYIRIWCTVAPTGSALDKRINSTKDPRNRVVVFEGKPTEQWNTYFDKGGKYTFVAQEYSKGSGYGGGYQGDPNGSDREDQLGAEVTLTLHVGQRGTQVIGPPGDQAELVVWVWNNNILRTTKEFEGEDSPAIVAASPSSRVQTAIKSAEVEEALEDLVGSSIFDATGDLESFVATLWDRINAHFAYPNHANADTDNVLANSWETAYGPTELAKFVNQALKSLANHYVNDAGYADEPPGTSGPDMREYHQDGGENVSDRVNLPLYQGVSSYAEAYGGLCDVYRSLAGHRANVAVHDYASAEGPGHSMPEASDLMGVHIAFLTVLATNNPTVPAAQSIGMQRLISVAGFKEG